MYGPYPVRPWMQLVGCLCVLAAVSLLCLLPVVMVDVMTRALARLHLSPEMAVLAVVGIFLGGLVNVPVYRIERCEPQPVELMGVFGLWGIDPRTVRMRRDTVIAVNVGGCVVPSLVAIWQIRYLGTVGGWPAAALCIVTAANIAVCYKAARPLRGVGIMMPSFLSPLVCVSLAWLLLAGNQYDAVRAPVAFVAGVCGPLVGADLLHLGDISRVAVGMLSIGGAGTFDGIVLSSILAALLT